MQARSTKPGSCALRKTVRLVGDVRTRVLHQAFLAMTGIFVIWVIFALGVLRVRHDHRRRVREARALYEKELRQLSLPEFDEY